MRVYSIQLRQHSLDIVCVSVCVKRERGIEGDRKSRMGPSTILEEEVKH